MTMDEYQKKAMATVLPTAKNLPYLSLGLAGEAGEISNRIKKWIRDEGSNPSKASKKAVAEELGDVLWYVSVLAEQLGFSLNEIAKNNTEKLASRKRRSKLSGSGDKR